MRHNKLKFILTLLITAISFSTFADHLSEKLLFTARLDGANNTTVTNADAHGIASFLLNGTRDTLQVNIAVANLTGPMIAAHIHEGAEGEDGPVVFPLDAFIEGPVIRTTITGTFLEENLSKFFDGSFYVNIHTEQGAQFGEVRGQIKLERDFAFYANLDTAQEVPQPSADAPIGSGNFVFDQDKTNLHVSIVTSGLTGVITGAHLHRAVAGENGGVVMNLSDLIDGTNLIGFLEVPAGLKDSLEAFVRNGEIYVNIHTDSNGAGEVRGQALFSDDLYFDGTLDTAQVSTPQVVASAGIGAGHGYINRSFDEFRYFFVIEDDSLSGPATSAGFYIGGKGSAGTLAKTVMIQDGNKIAGKWSASDAEQPLTDAQILEFLYGNVYLLVNTAGNPNGEIRGQLTRAAREGYVFELDTAQAVPSPTIESNGVGGGMVSIAAKRTSAHYMLAWDSLTGPVTPINGADPTGLHFHLGVSGEVGDVLYAIEHNNNAAFGYWNAANGFTPGNELQFRRDSVYVNLHTEDNAPGEIRGNVTRNYEISSETGVTTSVNNVLDNNTPFTLYPNPVVSNATLEVNANTAFEGQVIINDMMGRVVDVQNFNATEGINKLNVETSTISEGVYILSIQNNAGVIATTRFVKR